MNSPKLGQEAKHRILVLDSGVGGLTVCEAILEQNDGVAITYVADNAYLPYGTKDERSIIDRLDKLVSHFLQREHVDLVVVACNTASTAVLPSLRAKHSLPIVGVVPAIKPAAAITKTGRFGLLATPATIARDYTQKLIDDFASDCEVVKVGSCELVELAEKTMLGEVAQVETLRREFSDFLSESPSPSVDVLVLGCTHFPWLKDEISEALPGVKLVDSSEAIARRVKGLLAGLQDRSQTLEHHIVFTGGFDQSSTLIDRVGKFGMEPLRLLDSDIDELRP